MTVSELGARMTSSEFSEMIAFENVYGLPDVYFMTGQICSTIARSFTGARVTAADFVPYFKAQKVDSVGYDSDDELTRKLIGFAGAHNRGVRE